MEPRSVCMRCRRPTRACYCAHVPRIETKTRVVVVQHPRERDVPIGTARMATLCLPNSELHVTTSVGESRELARSLADPSRPAILLSPGEDARDIVNDPPKTPVTLVVVDGTWSQAAKIIKRDPALRALPRYAFTPAAPSEYRIRREPEETFVSTIEALALALAALEGKSFDALFAPFRAMVEFQLDQAALHHTRRQRKPGGPKPPKPRLPAIVLERARDLVCVVGESNAWPYTSPERTLYPEELVHWAAVRVSTGEHFDAMLEPRNPLAPRTLRWVELAESDLRGTLEDLAERWRAFAKPTDVIASWGTYATKIFESSGLPLSRPRVDLRDAARMWSRGIAGSAKRDGANGRVGTLEELAVRWELAPRSFGSGRANRRLAILAALATFFENHTERSDPNVLPGFGALAPGPGPGLAGPP
jgi:DTW domain-containing protein YfiP